MATTHGTLLKHDGIFAKLEAAADAAHLRAFGSIQVSAAERPRVAATLNRCIEAATDAEKTYAIAATNVRDGRLRVMLHDQAKRRGALVSELQGLLESLGCEAENAGTTTGALRRGLLDLKIALGSAGGRALLAECEQADGRAVAVYDGARKQVGRHELAGIDAILEAQRGILVAGQTGLRLLLVDKPTQPRNGSL
jgi:uncharacterized protein (TIGR02284 family)